MNYFLILRPIAASRHLIELARPRFEHAIRRHPSPAVQSLLGWAMIGYVVTVFVLTFAAYFAVYLALALAVQSLLKTVATGHS
jgi:hypothetical protein